MKNMNPITIETGGPVVRGQLEFLVRAKCEHIKIFCCNAMENELKLSQETD